MIWFLRIFSLFFLVLAIATYSQKERSLTQSTTTVLKFEPIVKVILQNYGVKALRVPLKNESLDGKLNGEDIKILISESVSNEKLSMTITGISHVEAETFDLVCSTKENSVQAAINLSQIGKTDLLSRVVFLFFGNHNLEQRMATFQSALPSTN